MANSVIATHQKGNHFSVAVGNHTIHIDTAVESGGTGLGPGPKVFMLLSLAGCTGLDIVHILNKMRVTFSDFSISVEGSLTSEDPKVYDKVAIVYTIKMDKADGAKMEKAINLSKDKYCGVSKMFKAFSEMTFRVDYL